MRYLADLLTLIRLIIATTMLVFAVTGAPAEAIFIMFIIAEATDIFDGTCARKWPFPKNKTPKYRKYAARFDMFADFVLAGAQVLFVTNQINQTVGLIISSYYLVSAVGGDFIIYGKPLGHPDDCTKYSLAKRNFPLAKKIVLARRYIYAFSLGLVNAIILFATGWPLAVKCSLLVLICLAYLFAWFFLDQRRKNITRDAVELEQKLSKKSRKPKQK